MARCLKRITVEGFGSYGVEQTLTLGGRGAVALVGDNGSGKSTIASKALVWCLFGKAAPERMGTSTQTLKGKAVVTDGKKLARVCVEIDDRASGELWTIERTRDRKGGDKISVVSSATGALTEDDIPHIVGCDYDVFTKTVVRGQGDVWAFAEATDARKREILDEVSGAVVLAPHYDRLKVVRDEARTRAAVLDGQRSAYATRLESARARVAALAQQRDDWQLAHAGDVEQRRATLRALEAAEQLAAQADTQAATIEAQRRALEAQRPTLDWAPYRDAERRAAQQLAQARADRAAAEARFNAVAGLAPGCTCPTCGQLIAPTAPVAIQRAAAEAPLAAAQAQEQAATAQHGACVTACAGAQAWLDDVLAQHQADLGALPPRVMTGQLAAAQQATRGAREALATAEQAENPYTTGVNVALVEAARFERDLAVLDEALCMNRTRLRLAEAGMEVMSPKGARAALAEATLTAIETEANRWLDALSGGAVSVYFRRADGAERIETIVRTLSRDLGVWVERDLIQFSGGERTRINLAVDLGVAAAFDAAGTAISLLVLDEAVFSGLDSAGQAAIVASLHGAGIADVVVVDHAPALAAALPRQVKATIGPDGYTRLTETSRCP